MDGPGQNKDVKDYLRVVYERIRHRDIGDALSQLDRAYSIDFENNEVNALLRNLRFWETRWERLEGLEDPFEKGNYLLMQWERFLDWSDRKQDDVGRMGDALKQMVYGEALRWYGELVVDDFSDTTLFMGMGKCYKGLGLYEEGARCFRKGVRHNKEDPVLLAQLADCCALMDITKEAKLFFREAFFLDPQAISLESLESGLIRRLIDKMREAKVREEEILEWVPIYGNIWGVFNVKRELRPIEYGKLKQSILSLQSESAQGRLGNWITPRLLNRYFWLIDYYIDIGEDRKTIDQVLMSIKLLSPSVYKMYVE